MPKIVVTCRDTNERDTQIEEELVKRGFIVDTIINAKFCNGLLSDEEEIELLRGASAVIASGERYPKNVLDSLPDLRVIARKGVGYDKVDVSVATSNRIVLTVTPNANHEAVSEQAMAFIFAVAKEITSRDKTVRSGQWIVDSLSPIRGSTLGIVGLGRIGRDLAVRAKAMKMNVLSTEPKPDIEFVKNNNISLVELDELVTEVDYLSLNCPLTEETRGIINMKIFNRMKSSSVLINTARGGLVVEKDLIEALETKIIRAAGLDVFELEPIDPGNPLLSMDNVVLSPHIAGTDIKSVEDMDSDAIMSVLELYQGRWPEDSIINNELKDGWQW